MKGNKLKGGDTLMDNPYMKYMPAAGPIYNWGLKEEKNPTKITNSAKMPSTKIIYKMLDNSYKEGKEEVEGWVPIKITNTLIAYKKDNTIIIALRGTDMHKSEDLAADLQIAFDELRNSVRYKDDVKYIKELQKQYPKNNYYYIGVGHSLSGAILDELLDEKYIEEALSFNPAVQKKHYNTPTKNRRIYMSNDPLHQILGKWVKYREVRNDNTDISKSHSLDMFKGGSINKKNILEFCKKNNLKCSKSDKLETLINHLLPLPEDIKHKLSLPTKKAILKDIFKN